MDDLPSFEISENVLHAYYDFYRKVDEALHKTDPRLDGGIHGKRSYSNSLSWWNEECNKLSRIRLAKLKNFLTMAEDTGNDKISSLPENLLS